LTKNETANISRNKFDNQMDETDSNDFLDALFGNRKESKNEKDKRNATFLSNLKVVMHEVLKDAPYAFVLTLTDELWSNIFTIISSYIPLLNEARINGLRVGGDIGCLQKGHFSNNERTLYTTKILPNVLSQFRQPVKSPHSKDSSVLSAIKKWEEEHSLTIPWTITELVSVQGIYKSVFRGDPCNHSIVTKDWSYEKLPGDRHGIQLVIENQGCCVWWAVWEDGDNDAEVWVSGFDWHDSAYITAYNIASFFMDFAKQGKKSYGDIGYGDGDDA